MVARTFKGYIDDIRFYERASFSEAMKLFKLEEPGHREPDT